MTTGAKCGSPLWPSGDDSLAAVDMGVHATSSAARFERVRPLANIRHAEIHSDLTPSFASGAGDLIDHQPAHQRHSLQCNRDGGEVRVVTCREGIEAVVIVSDTGPGIAEADLPHIFKRFYRADKSRARADGRNGLGLAICKAIVDAHGGQISATTELGKGTSITVRLPLANHSPDGSVAPATA